MKNKIKKGVATFFLSLMMLFGAVMPKDAHAYLVVGGTDVWKRNWNYNGPFLNTIYILTCVYFLPLCLLDEKNSSVQLTTENLIAQGFSSEEVTTIMSDQKLLTKRLFDNNMKLEVRSTDTRESIRSEVLSIAPEVSDLYLNFLFEVKGL